MKTTIYNVFAIMIAMACSSILFPATAQENKKEEDPMIHGSENPFPLSEEQRLSLLQEVEKEVELYRGRYDSPDLSTWDESDRNAYLIAKARRVALMIMPVYYRTYPTKNPTISMETFVKFYDPTHRLEPCYKVCFYANPEMEDIRNKKDELISVFILEKNGEAGGIFSSTTTHGIGFSPPEWEDGVYKKILKGEVSPFRYFTGYEIGDSAM